MRFCSFSSNGSECFGVELHPEEVVDLPSAARLLVSQGNLPEAEAELVSAVDLKSFLKAGSRALKAAGRVRDLLLAKRDLAAPVILEVGDIQMRPPITNPGKIIGVGLNYRDHAEEQKVSLPQQPMIFSKFTTSLIGPGEEIVLPEISQKVDPEAELCAVILEEGRGFTTEAARQAIAGYTVGNDVSARDLQFSDRQWVRGKSCDTFAPCGPFLVTEEELGDPHRLKIELSVNGELRQSSNTENQIFNCFELVSFISQTITLEPGDLIFAGTPAGVGVFRDPPVFLAPGDIVEVTIDRIGTLQNPVLGFR